MLRRFNHDGEYACNQASCRKRSGKSLYGHQEDDRALSTEIKSRAANDDFIFVCDYVDDGGLKLINKMKREMNIIGIVVRLYEDGAERPSELFDNLEKLHNEINMEECD